MSNPKLLLVLLFLIGLLFVLSLTLGAMHQDDSTFQSPDWAHLFVHSQSLKIGDLSSTTAPCLQGENLVVPQGSTCAVSISQSSFTEWTVELQLVQGNSASVKLTQEKALPVEQTLAAPGATTDPKQMDLHPGQDQGTLNLACLESDTSTCVFTLL